MRKVAKPVLRESVETLPVPLQALLKRGGAVGKTGKVFRDLGAASTTSNLILLQQILQTKRPAKTLEVGMAFGASTFVFAHYHAANGASVPCHVAIDPFQSSVWDNVGVKLLESGQLADCVRHIPALSSVALPALVAAGDSIDFAYIDGSHLFEDVFLDFCFIDQLLQLSGHLLFDDSTHPDVYKVISFIRYNLADRYLVIDCRTCYASGWLNGLRHTVIQRLRRNQLTCFRKIGSGPRAWNAHLRNF